jgi:hypothetical protein
VWVHPQVQPPRLARGPARTDGERAFKSKAAMTQRRVLVEAMAAEMREADVERARSNEEVRHRVEGAWVSKGFGQTSHRLDQLSNAYQPLPSFHGNISSDSD